MVTTVNLPTPALFRLASRRDLDLIVVADSKTPLGWRLPGARFVGLDEQAALYPGLHRTMPLGHYARKMFGYLIAISSGASVIIETDDDNLPYATFGQNLSPLVTGDLIEGAGWVNVYRYFTDQIIWPRGFPLQFVLSSMQSAPPSGPTVTRSCPVQQYLADGDTDVDAAYRLTRGEEVDFRSASVILASGSYSPFNSQNTVWWPQAYALMYLPVTATFRLCDIWRSFVAQVLLHTSGQSVSFGSATVRQYRNEHNLLKDFAEEVPGYLRNEEMVTVLRDVADTRHGAMIATGMRAAYQALVHEAFVEHEELATLDAWLHELVLLGSLGTPTSSQG